MLLANATGEMLREEVTPKMSAKTIQHLKCAIPLRAPP